VDEDRYEVLWWVIVRWEKLIGFLVVMHGILVGGDNRKVENFERSWLPRIPWSGYSNKLECGVECKWMIALCD